MAWHSGLSKVTLPDTFTLNSPAEPHRPGLLLPTVRTPFWDAHSPQLLTSWVSFAQLGGSEGMTKLGKAVAQRKNNDGSKHAPGAWLDGMPRGSEVRAAHLGRGRRRPRGHSCLAAAGSQTGAGERGQGPLTRLQPPTPPRRAGPASAPQPLLRERVRELRGPRLGLLFPRPQIKGSRHPGHRPLTTPSPTRRMVGAAGRIQAKPVGGAASTRAFGITASWGFRIS